MARKSFTQGKPEQFEAVLENKIAELRGSHIKSSVTSAVDDKEFFDIDEHAYNLIKDDKVGDYAYELGQKAAQRLNDKGFDASSFIEGGGIPHIGIEVNGIHDIFVKYLSEIAVDWGKIDEAADKLADEVIEKFELAVSDDITDDYVETLGLEVVGLLEAQGFEAYSSVENDYLEIEIVDDDGMQHWYIQPIDEIQPNWDDINTDASTVAAAVIEEIGL